MTDTQEFWKLVEENEITGLALGQIVNAPVKVLLQWWNDESVPDQAIADLKKFLGRD